MYGKASAFNGFRQLYHAQTGNCPVGFWLFRFQPLHQPAVLLWRQCLHFVLAPGPLEAAAFQPFIQQQEVVTLPVQRLDAVPLPAAEQEQGGLKRIHLELRCHHPGQPVNTAPQVRVTARDVDRAMAIEVIQHDFSALQMASNVAASAPG